MRENKSYLRWNNSSVRVLLKMLRIALGNEKVFSLPNVVNWQEVFELAVMQGVPNICYDGAHAIMNEDSYAEMSLNTPEWENLRYKWLGYGMCADLNYRKHENVISFLSHICEQNGFKMLLLKGHGLSLYYPIPSHRLSGDIDIYIMSDMGENASRCSDMVISKELGIRVTKARFAHHSHFTVQGISVENHYEFGNTYYGSEQSKKIESRLVQLSEQARKEIYFGSQKVLVPSPTFNALFLMSHLATHFCSSRISLKQICDWMMFLIVEHTNVDWILVREIYKDVGLTDFANMVNGFLVHYLGMEESFFPGLIRDSSFEEKLLEDILSRKEYNTLWGRVFRYHEYAWKYKLVYQAHWIVPFWQSVILHCFNREDMVEETIQ